MPGTLSWLQTCQILPHYSRAFHNLILRLTVQPNLTRWHLAARGTCGSGDEEHGKINELQGIHTEH